MQAVNVIKLRQHLPDFLKKDQQCGKIAVILHGKTIARIVESNRENAFNVSEKLMANLGLQCIW